jgi:rod shape-determining protein MreD
MITNISQNIIRFFGLLLVQIFLLNNIQLNGYLNPYLYILFIIMLPFDIPAWLLLLAGFIYGLIVDMFADTMGMHASATVFLCYARIGVLGFIAPREGYDSSHQPTFTNMGFRWFLIYSGFLVFVHHLLLFFLEAFSFNNFMFTFLKVVFSSAFTLTLIFITQMLFKPADKALR